MANATATKTRTAAAAKAAIDNAKNPAKLRAEKLTVGERAEGAMKRFMDAADELLAEMGAVSWKRRLTAYVASVVLAGTIGYVGYTLTNALMMTAAVASTPMLIQFLVFVLAFVATIYVAGRVSGYVGRCIIDGTIERGVEAGFTRVRNWFAFTPNTVAA